MTQQWYYADRQRQQCGPVSADELKAALQRGDVDMATLVWHERLPAWVPLAQVAAELGLGGVAPRPYAASARTAAPPPRRRTGLIVACVLIGCVPVFGGCLAAIALPAYNDYTVRARVTQAYALASLERDAVENFFANNDRCPHNGDEGFGEPASYASQYVATLRFTSGDDERCEIRARLRNPGQSRLDGAEFTLHMDRARNWTSSTNIPNRFLPPGLRP